MNKAEEVQNKSLNKPMSREEEIEFYRNMSDKQKLKITFLFMNFGHKLEQKENPEITVVPYSD